MYTLGCSFRAEKNQWQDHLTGLTVGKYTLTNFNLIRAIVNPKE
ncbi:MAG: hypothetical protein HW384_157 [Dehalococcoidia bacterium]|nr:hypothetical protein [Dehalococcoidia bacterium]MBF8304534.1 hypothetical protein [Dehalococcoidia bacterium]